MSDSITIQTASPLAQVSVSIALDEAAGSIPSLSQTFQSKVGRTILDYLAALQTNF